MFDPFGDYESAGYLRNVRKDKHEVSIKSAEHTFFRIKLDAALNYLSTRKNIEYTDFLQVHRILFSAYYPWAGEDRLSTTPNKAITKGKVSFCHPQDIRRAVSYGLKLGQNKKAMAHKLGEVMGLFAYGHPFLDGNGRTMLLVHHELAHRAGFSVRWEATNKQEYLDALTQEICSPGQGNLDGYLLPFKAGSLARGHWGERIFSMPGLDGAIDSKDQANLLSDPAVLEKYQQFEARRAYRYLASPVSGEPGNGDVRQ
ncbi:MAG: Fic family protein [Rhodoferax sp.]|nr:Fic family protein [Rhodoferax sp.]